jgi:F-type H+-transporting ATPase subunit alpha
LERSTHLSDELKGGSITALPIIETEAQNISAYIPTNLISITDGQIYLSPKLFELGILPAIDVGKSVSRVGGKAQLPAYRSIIGNLKLDYAQFEELESFSRFGTRMDEDTKKIIERGKRIRICFKQQDLQPISVTDQILILFALTNGLFDTIPIDKMKEAEFAMQKMKAELSAEMIKRLVSDKELSNSDQETILNMARSILESFQKKPDTDENNA